MKRLIWWCAGIVALGTTLPFVAGASAVAGASSTNVVPTGVVTSYASLPNPGDPYFALTADPEGNLYTVDEATCQVVEIDATTQAVSTIPTPGARPGWCSIATNMAYGVVAGEPFLYFTSRYDGNQGMFAVIVPATPTGGQPMDQFNTSITQGATGISIVGTQIYFIAGFDLAVGNPLLYRQVTTGGCSYQEGFTCGAIRITNTNSLASPIAQGLLVQNSTAYFLTNQGAGLLESIPITGGSFTGNYDAVSNQTIYGTPTDDPAGNIYYPDSQNGNIYELPAGATSSTKMPLIGPATLDHPYGGPVYANGSLFVINSNGSTSNIEKISFLPDPPTNVMATPGNSSATVSWTGAPGATSYTATASPGGASCTTTSTLCTITGLTNGATYSIAVTSNIDGGSSAPSESIQVLLPTLASTGSNFGLFLTASVVAFGLGGATLVLRRTRSSTRRERSSSI